MTPLIIGFIGLAILFVLLLSRMPIGLVMAVVGFAGFAYIAGFSDALGVLRLAPYATFASYHMRIIPLFLLMGAFCYYSGLSKDLYDTVHAWLGHFRGGLSMATVGACAGFAAVSGSSLATAATMGTVALPEMKRYKYDDRLATGSVAAGGTIGILKRNPYPVRCYHRGVHRPAFPGRHYPRRSGGCLLPLYHLYYLQAQSPHGSSRPGDDFQAKDSLA